MGVRCCAGSVPGAERGRCADSHPPTNHFAGSELKKSSLLANKRNEIPPGRLFSEGTHGGSLQNCSQRWRWKSPWIEKTGEPAILLG